MSTCRYKHDPKQKRFDTTHADPGCPLAFSISPSFKKFLSLALCLLKIDDTQVTWVSNKHNANMEKRRHSFLFEPLFPTSSSAKSRSRTLDGNKEDTIAVVLAAVYHDVQREYCV